MAPRRRAPAEPGREVAAGPGPELPASEGRSAAPASRRRPASADETGVSGPAHTSHRITTTAAPVVPHEPTATTLRAAAAGCRACPLWERGTQTVFGAGPPNAELILVGEQPGDEEDLAGQPFVGPAGRLLDRALADAGIDRRSAYVTNAVKHFKWETRGKRRIHQKPTAGEVRACLPWLEAELALIRPRAVVCLGATAAQALLGRDFRVTEHRGAILRSLPLAPLVMATVHPSSILRAPDEATRHRDRQRFVDDLAGLAAALHASEGATPHPP